jgi:hypothetical protein
MCNPYDYRRRSAAKAFELLSDSVISLFACPSLILQGGAGHFKVPTVVDCRQNRSRVCQSDKL